ncbi:MAG: zinc ribbon domain-containing protein [Vampirovibrionia bacterium]
MEICPSCNAPVDSNSKFCNECGYNLLQDRNVNNVGLSSNKSYKLRSPILESAVLYDGTNEKKYGMLVIISYSFWLFAIVLIILGIITIYKNYTIDLFLSIKEATFLFVLSFGCFVIPGIVNLLVDIEESISGLIKDAKKGRFD